MKLAQSLALIITGGSSFGVIPFALADFNVTKFINQIGIAALAACSSKAYGCNCFPYGTNAAKVVSNATSGAQLASLPENTFSVESGFCGSAFVYDFYNRSDGTWELYEHGGNGIVQGTCHPNTKSVTTCDDGHYENIVLYDQLVCSSGLCSN